MALSGAAERREHGLLTAPATPAAQAQVGSCRRSGAFRHRATRTGLPRARTVRRFLLGLQIVRTLVTEELGGTLELHDRPGGGLAAVVAIPVPGRTGNARRACEPVDDHGRVPGGPGRDAVGTGRATRPGLPARERYGA